MARYNIRRPRADQVGQPFPFLKLSGELRNVIYKLVVTSSTPIEPLQTIRKTVMKLPIVERPHEKQPAITRVSRQLRSEALPFYYSENVFDFKPCSLSFGSPFFRFSNIGDETLKHIRSVQFSRLRWPGLNILVTIKPDNSGMKITCEYWSSRERDKLTVTRKQDMAMTEALREHVETTETGTVCGLHLLEIVRET
ncbi:hypothetical protein FKW77_010277 [Venturia effusa]|uniref:Uncharacterized protein n=1 Tax=Venturia effusa TaxID=50376 RepID=A0A517KXM3_9PEZI|nr:hypothetical protein FKW77_010277 [Venturia effusa]